MKVYDHSNEPEEIRTKLLVRDLNEAQIRLEQEKATSEALRLQLQKEQTSKKQYIENLRRMQNKDGIIAVRSLCLMILNDRDGKTSGKALAKTVIKLLGGDYYAD